MEDALPVISFEDGRALRGWLARNHQVSTGLWVRIFNGRSRVPSVTFQELLEQGLCFGWSESRRRRGEDETFFLQRFTPRRRPGTNSDRNKALVRRLVLEGQMTEQGLRALGMLDAGSSPLGSPSTG